MRVKRALFAIFCMTTILAANVSPCLAQVLPQGPTVTVLIRHAGDPGKSSPYPLGISAQPLAAGDAIATVTLAQKASLEAQGLQVQLLKSVPQSSPLRVQSGQLSNEYVTLLVDDWGRFTMWTADGRYLLYPSSDTGYLSIKVDGSIYDNRNGTLSILTPFTAVDAGSAYIQFSTPEHIIITQRYSLQGEAVQFTIEARNQGGATHHVSARYLFDTQLDINDGAPLYAPTIGVRTYETDMPFPSFNRWAAYDRWPQPTLTSGGTFSTQPVRMVFAWWPDARQSSWDYVPDPGQPFYTPGYNKSPLSDSCALLYFDMGTLGPGSQRNIVTYYGTGEPVADANRERLITAFRDFKEAIKASMLADLDAFASLQSHCIASLRNDWKDYLGIAWSIVDAVVIEPSDLAKLGKDLKALETVADLVENVDSTITVSKELTRILAQAPVSAPETEIKDDYIYPRFLNESVFTPRTGGAFTGVSGYRSAVDTAYQAYLAQIPDPLPANYPLDNVINFLQQQTVALYASSSRETYVMGYAENMCTMAKLGVLQAQEDTVFRLADTLEVAENVSLASTIADMALVVGGGALKIAGFVGAPVTLGGSTVVLFPSEVVFWGGIATLRVIASAAGSLADVKGMSLQGAIVLSSYEAMAQLPTDLALRFSIFQSSGEWLASSAHLARPEAAALAEAPAIQVDGINIPNLVLPADQAQGQGTGEMLIRNTGSQSANVGIYGTITAEMEGGAQTVGLLGTSPVSVAAGVQRSVQLNYSLLRSTLLDHGGYDVHLYITAASPQRLLSVQGPFVAHLYAGTAAQMAMLNQQTFRMLEQGSLATGEASSQEVQFRAGTESARLLLSFAEGSDCDLHLYDSSGRHTGVNYATGQTEHGIPGATYSGSTAWPEQITIANPAAGAYTARVVAQNAAVQTGYALSSLEIPPLPPMLDAPARVHWSVLRANRDLPLTETFGLQIAEAGGSQAIGGLRATLTDLEDGYGHRIQASQVSLQLPSSITAGTSVLGQCTVTILPAVPPGTYHGVLQVSGTGPGDATLIVVTQVTLDVNEAFPEANWFVRLPMLVRDYRIGPVTGPTRTPTPTRTRTPTPTRTYTPRPTRSPTPGSYVWQQEAEAGAIAAPMSIAQDASASGGQYVYSSQQELNPPGAGSAVFQFNIAVGGTYYLWARVMPFGWNNNSFYVSLDGAQPVYYEILETTVPWSSWGWSQVKLFQEPIVGLPLQAGAHTLTFAGREPDVRLDRLLLTADPNLTP